MNKSEWTVGRHNNKCCQRKPAGHVILLDRPPYTNCRTSTYREQHRDYEDVAKLQTRELGDQPSTPCNSRLCLTASYFRPFDCRRRELRVVGNPHVSTTL